MSFIELSLHNLRQLNNSVKFGFLCIGKLVTFTTNGLDLNLCLLFKTSIIRTALLEDTVA